MVIISSIFASAVFRHLAQCRVAAHHESFRTSFKPTMPALSSPPLTLTGDFYPGWCGTPFYWPVIRAQAHAPTAIYTSETID